MFYYGKVVTGFKNVVAKKLLMGKLLQQLKKKKMISNELMFYCVGDNHDQLCKIDGETFLLSPRTHGLMILEHPTTTLTIMVAYLM